MYRAKYTFLIVLLCILLCSCSTSPTNAEMNLSQPEETLASNESNTPISATAQPTLAPSPAPSATTFYSAEEWINEEGHMDYPFDLSIMLTDTPNKFDMLDMPQEALDIASTEDLLSIIKRWPLQDALDFNTPSDYLWVMSNYNFMEEFWSRDNIAEVTLAVYKTEAFLPIRSIRDKDEQKAYNRLCYAQERAIVTGEVFLATDIAFEQMDDAMRKETLAAISEKNNLRTNELFAGAPESCGFYAHIGDLMASGTGSKWYDYLKETQPENTELFEYLDSWSGVLWNGWSAP